MSAGKENNCHEFMGYIFIKAIQDLTERLGSDMVKILMPKNVIGKVATGEVADHEIWACAVQQDSTEAIFWKVDALSRDSSHT